MSEPTGRELVEANYARLEADHAQLVAELAELKHKYNHLKTQWLALGADPGQLVALVREWADAKVAFDEKRLDEDFAWRERHRRLEAAEQALLTYRKECCDE